MVQIEWMPSVVHGFVGCPQHLLSANRNYISDAEAITSCMSGVYHLYVYRVLPRTKNMNGKTSRARRCMPAFIVQANGFAHLMLSIHMLDMNNFSGKIFHETKVNCELRIHIHISETANIYQANERTRERQRRR